ncbi:MFS transporter [Prauserella marina]|uniref:Predicted arabinose efflux permease, MFS family n=1 Tax=Prauserella marina TaxID=530584 RepID=A0A222VIK1_9PSEU|nr:MFS transporter [Prauserella marina]ASR33750.1 MFS transporter [Prauserella marina]PWV82322.1 putative MFS family arabinose efflux permease [Prauserella marina]SDC66274.1 Predicted arabinose efflux permease, MFS family [Prauserella marina]
MRDRSSRGLNWLLGSSAVTNLGDGIGKVAFPLLATTVTRDPLLIAGLSAAQFVPWLLFAVLAGALLDRIDRRKAIVYANLARAAAVGAMATLVLLDAVSIWAVYAAALLVGAAETVADSAANVLIPSVVGERGKLAGANSKLQATEILGQTFLGGPIGSLTFALFAAMPFLLNSFAFAIGAALMMAVAGSFRPKPSSAQRSLKADLGEGLRWLRGNSLLLRLVLIAGLFSLVTEFAQAQLVLYALEDLGLEPAAFGVFAFVGGIGGLAGAAIAPRLLGRLGRRAVLVSGIVTAAIGFGGMGLSGDPVLSSVLFGLFAGAVVVVNVMLATARHELVPGELLGRVLGVWRTIVWGAIPVGALLGGVLTDLLGSPSTTFAISGGLLLALAAVALVSFRPSSPT